MKNNQFEDLTKKYQSKILCQKCKLTIYASSNEKLNDMGKRISCNCNAPPSNKRYERDIWRGRHQLQLPRFYNSCSNLERFITTIEDNSENHF